MGQLAEAGNTTTLAHYLHLLDTSGMLNGIEKFSPGMVRQRSSSPKFQVHNTALITAQQHRSFSKLRSQPERWGRWIESAIGAHLLNRSLEGGFQLYYWRHRNDEVDFVIESQDRIIAIEVKSGQSEKARGMAAFQQQHDPYKMLMVGTKGIPWQEFLKIDPMELFN